MEVKQIGLTNPHAFQFSQNPLQSLKKGFDIGLDKDEKVSDTKKTIEKMLADIEEIKDRMDFDLTVDNVMKYKKIIQSFLGFYVNNVYGVDVLRSRSREGHLDKMMVVKKVEQGVQELDDAMKLLDTKSGHLDMLKRIGEINGLILNKLL